MEAVLKKDVVHGTEMGALVGIIGFSVTFAAFGGVAWMGQQGLLSSTAVRSAFDIQVFGKPFEERLGFFVPPVVLIEDQRHFMTKLDVCLCDGFVGNVVLKSCEATAKAMSKWLK